MRPSRGAGKVQHRDPANLLGVNIRGGKVHGRTFEEIGIVRRLAARLNHYRFDSVWELAVPCEVVFEALQDVMSYPAWWPEVKAVYALDGSTVAVTIRAALPYTLRFDLEQQVSDSGARVLQASMTGDLEGWSRWSVVSRGDGCLLKFEEEVQVNRRLLRLLSPVARPFLKANHSLMMYRGEKGLRRFLSGNSRLISRVSLDERPLQEPSGVPATQLGGKESL